MLSYVQRLNLTLTLLTLRLTVNLTLMNTDPINPTLLDLTLFERLAENFYPRYCAAKRYAVAPLISFGREHSLSCCPLSSAFEATTRAYRHLANETELEMGQTDRQIGIFAYIFCRCFFLYFFTGRLSSPRSSDANGVIFTKISASYHWPF